MGENGTTVSTEFGDVVLDDTTPDTGSETQQPGSTDGSEPATAAEVAEQMYKVGGAEYTPAQLAQFIEEARNAKAMRRAADERYKEAKRLQDDPEQAEVMRIRQLLAQNPALRNEWQAMKQWMAGKSQTPGGTGQAHILAKLQALESRFEEVDKARDLESAKSTLDTFLEMHNKIPGAEPWTRDSDAFLEFYDAFEAGTEARDTDIAAYFWKTEGPRLMESVAASGRTAGKAEVAQAITAGRRATKNTTAPSGQRAPSEHEPDMTNPGFNKEIDAAIGDDSIFAKL